MNKHVNKVRKATGRAEAITAGRQNCFDIVLELSNTAG